MKRLLTLCLALSLGGCAGKKAPELPQPVNGRCGIVQDACLLGDPSGTGNITPPYGWMCLGRYGGRNDTCSVPIARIEEDEVVAGQNALEEKVKEAGPLRGLLTVVDGSITEPGYSHADRMKDYILDMGIPEENIHMSPIDLNWIFIWGDNSTVRENTLVFSFPNTGYIGGASKENLDIIREHNFLVVAAAGNTETYGNRDVWYPDHPYWKTGVYEWKNNFVTFATGKVILAKYADRDENNGNIIPNEHNVKCGMAKEYCYSIMFASPRISGYLGIGTSSASVRLGALAFYLFQLWDTPREVVNVLNVCAEDVGAPGIDEEYGRGVVSVVCDTVQNRERKAVASSMQVSNWSSPVMAEMTGEYDRHLVPQSLSPRSSPARFRPFYRVRGNDTESFTGHLGGRFSLRGTDLFVSGGTTYSPLGIHSSLRSSARTPFMEFGAGRSLFSRNGHSVLLLGTYGYGEGGNLSAHAGRLGVRYDRHFGPAVLSLRALYRRVQGHLGIPGHRKAGADPVPFADDTPEVFLSFSLGGRVH